MSRIQRNEYIFNTCRIYYFVLFCLILNGEITKSVKVKCFMIECLWRKNTTSNNTNTETRNESGETPNNVEGVPTEEKIKNDVSTKFNRQNYVEGLTEDQIAEFKERFLIFDKDGDSLITMSQLYAAMKSIGKGLTKEKFQDMMNEVGTDGAGMIDFIQFIEIMARRMKYNDNEDEIKAAFEVLDKDSDGFISADEFRHILVNSGEDELTNEEVDEMFKEADINGSDQINYEKFGAMIKPK